MPGLPARRPLRARRCPPSRSRRRSRPTRRAGGWWTRATAHGGWVAGCAGWLVECVRGRGGEGRRARACAPARPGHPGHRGTCFARATVCAHDLRVVCMPMYACMRTSRADTLPAFFPGLQAAGGAAAPPSVCGAQRLPLGLLHARGRGAGTAGARASGNRSCWEHQWRHWGCRRGGLWGCGRLRGAGAGAPVGPGAGAAAVARGGGGGGCDSYGRVVRAGWARRGAPAAGSCAAAAAVRVGCREGRAEGDCNRSHCNM